jgi:hypothetical protein
VEAGRCAQGTTLGEVLVDCTRCARVGYCQPGATGIVATTRLGTDRALEMVDTYAAGDAAHVVDLLEEMVIPLERFDALFKVGITDATV